MGIVGKFVSIILICLFFMQESMAQEVYEFNFEPKVSNSYHQNSVLKSMSTGLHSYFRTLNTAPLRFQMGAGVIANQADQQQVLQIGMIPWVHKNFSFQALLSLPISRRELLENQDEFNDEEYAFTFQYLLLEKGLFERKTQFFLTSGIMSHDNAKFVGEILQQSRSWEPILGGQLKYQVFDRLGVLFESNFQLQTQYGLAGLRLAWNY